MLKNFKIKNVFGLWIVQHIPSKTATIPYKSKEDAILIRNQASNMEEQGIELRFPMDYSC
jgi:hypothetical protein